MSSAGHVFDMINRIRNNEILLKSRRDRIKRIKKAYYEMVVYKNNDYQNKALSENELKLIKQRIRTRLKKETRIIYVKSIVVTILVVGLLIIGFIILIQRYGGILNLY